MSERNPVKKEMYLTFLSACEKTKNNSERKLIIGLFHGILHMDSEVVEQLLYFQSLEVLQTLSHYIHYIHIVHRNDDFPGRLVLIIERMLIQR